MVPFDFQNIPRSKIEKPAERCIACISICDPSMLPGVGYGSLRYSIRGDFESVNLSTPCAVKLGLNARHWQILNLHSSFKIQD